MAKRRGRIVETEKPREQVHKVGGNDFDYCVRLFLDELELRNLAYHTRRWHKENLHYVKQTLNKLDLPTEPIKLLESQFKQCILYWMRESKLSPTTINHRIRSMKQLYAFLINEDILDKTPINVEKLKTPKRIIRPFDDEEIGKLFAQPDKSSFVGYRDFRLMLVLLDMGVRLSELELCC